MCTLICTITICTCTCDTCMYSADMYSIDMYNHDTCACTMYVQSQMYSHGCTVVASYRTTSTQSPCTLSSAILLPDLSAATRRHMYVQALEERRG